MIFDRTLLFSNAQAVTASVASTDNIDTLPTGTVYGAAAALVKDIGKGQTIPIVAQVVEDFNNLTSLTAAVQTATDAAFTSPKDVQSQTKVLADLKAGANFNFGTVPLGTSQRFVRLYYTVTGSAPTTGKITAGVVEGLQTSGVGF